jgi:hypothetical protein
MRLRLPIISIAMIVALAPVRSAFAQDEARSAQLAAANASGVRVLMNDIGQQTIQPGLSVRDLLDRTGGQADLATLLQHAQQIGGPRWVDDQTCQVRLEITGTQVAAKLVLITAANPSTTPITPQALAARLHDWDARTFSATGTSTGRVDAQDVLPPSRSSAWATVTAAQRREAVEAARRDAINRVMASVAAVELKGGRPIGTALANPAPRTAMDAWLTARPVILVEFRDDGTVAVTVSITADALGDAIAQCISRDPAGAAAIGGDGPRLHTAIASAMADPIGTAAVAAVTTQPQHVAWMAREPRDRWSGPLQRTAIGTGRTRLMAARTAEELALAQLRTALLAMPLSPPPGSTAPLAAEPPTRPMAPMQPASGPSVAGFTLGMAAQRDPRVEAAVDRVMQRAHLYKIEYRPDGSAAVSVQLDLRDVRNELETLP